MGSTKLHYTFTAADQYYFNLVISNTRVPVAGVAVVIEGRRVALKRSSNNNWAYHNSQGRYTFPMDITITPVCGEAVRICPEQFALHKHRVALLAVPSRRLLCTFIVSSR